MSNVRLTSDFRVFCTLLRSLTFLGCLLFLDCHRGLLVIAPHPDDEVLMAAGTMRAALAEKKRVSVVVVTNGDATCSRDGFVRQRETLSALTAIGVQPHNITFLGYPDGDLDALNEYPLAPTPRRNARGECELRTGASADMRSDGQTRPWTSGAIVADLRALLRKLRPATVVVTHPDDTHRDHSMSYAFLRQALGKQCCGKVQVLRSFVHGHDPSWPGASPGGGYAPERHCPAMPNYQPTLRIAVDPAWKLGLITRYTSQLEHEVRADWLASFACDDEVFYAEMLCQ